MNPKTRETQTNKNSEAQDDVEYTYTTTLRVIRKLGEGKKTRRRLASREEKNAEIKIWNRFEFKTLNGIKCGFGKLCASKWISKCICMWVCMCMCVLKVNIFSQTLERN